MATEATQDVGATTGEIAELERKLTEVRAARSRTIEERAEHARDASRAATVFAGLEEVHRELGALANERSATRDVAQDAYAVARDDVARLVEAGATADALARDLEARLAVARENAARSARERTVAERVLEEATAERDRAEAEHGDTARAAAEVALRYDAARAEATIASGRDMRFNDIEETLVREEALVEGRLRDARTRVETAQVEHDLARIRDLEDRLGKERVDLERRLRAIRSNAEPVRADDVGPSAASTFDVAPAAPRRTEALVAPTDAPPRAESESALRRASDAAERPRISLAERLLRDLATPSASA